MTKELKEKIVFLENDNDQIIIYGNPQDLFKIKNAITSSEYYDDEENIYADYIESINSIVKTSYKMLFIKL